MTIKQTRAASAAPWGRYRNWGLGVLLAVMTLLAYLPAIRGGFIWDDDNHFARNPVMTAPHGLVTIWTTPAATYYPLVLTNFWAQRRLWNLNPVGYHLVTLAFHLATALLLWRLLRRLRVPGAWLAGAIFALHPVQVDSAAWVTELKNTQSAFFYVLAIWAFVKFVALRELRERPGESRGRKVLWYAASLGLFILALTSKPSTVVLPAVLLLYLAWKNRRWSRADFIAVAPFFVIALLAAAWTIWEQQNHSGAVGVDWSETPLQRVALSGRIIWFYLGKLLWPDPLMFVYPRWAVDPGNGLSYVPAVLAAACFVMLWVVRRKFWPVLMAAAYFVICLFPVLNFFRIYYTRYSYVADHFAYLADMGVMAAIAAALAIGTQWLVRRWNRKAAAAFRGGSAMVLLCVLGILTYQRCFVYADAERLWLDTVAKDPNSFLAHSQLGTIYFDRARGDPGRLGPDMGRAIGEFARAALLRPEMGVGWTNLGNGLAAVGRIDEARAAYQRALAAKDTNAGDQSYLHLNIGGLLARQGRLAEAETEFCEALRLNADLAAAYHYLGILVRQRGGATQETRGVLEGILVKYPGNSEARKLLDEINAGAATSRGRSGN